MKNLKIEVELEDDQYALVSDEATKLGMDLDTMMKKIIMIVVKDMVKERDLDLHTELQNADESKA